MPLPETHGDAFRVANEKDANIDTTTIGDCLVSIIIYKINFITTYEYTDSRITIL